MARRKEFDENAVLQKAMLLFLEQGYEKTSMSELVEQMGIHRRSLYDTFIDKHTLFLKAMDRYAKLLDANLAQGVKRSKSAKKAIRFIFDYVIEGDQDLPFSCLFVNTAIELASRDIDADTKTTEGFTKAEQLIADIIHWGQQDGEFSSNRDAKELAECLHNTLVGLRVMGRTSASKEKLRRIADLSMKILDEN
ncbi:TetR/AcrR family transcriptional regulator [Pseudalkalibacillus salsuginis]|uniref:TetR/AcrR family transcriptional regulator n=1 Tax=Pseudalkalibacillus salsuginis TaxID=2910972 RepID=UPI001F417FDC|nr:TetR/AcrR family transcriptional regulator [Pseudalkalibacillus salsuginis]MCF6411707.1 TetR/AcrR family transcriptional regulator [Pseudalkalibacillus salsuginis]